MGDRVFSWTIINIVGVLYFFIKENFVSQYPSIFCCSDFLDKFVKTIRGYDSTHFAEHRYKYFLSKKFQDYYKRIGNFVLVVTKESKPITFPVDYIRTRIIDKFRLTA